jgi:hypothetical protein
MIRKTALFAVALLASACSAEKKEEAPAAVATPQQVGFHAVDNAFHGPDTISAGMTTVTLTNGGKNLHHVQFIRLDSGKTIADLQAALKPNTPPPAWAIDVPGPNGADPGGTSNITLDMKPGNYAVMCFVDVPDHVPHFAKGMIKSLTVIPATGPSAPAPTADINIAMSDYAFNVSKPITAGKHVFQVTSTGPQSHEVMIIRFQPGKTMDDLGKWMEKPVGPPPANAIGGTSGQTPGVTATFEAEITPGEYVILCFVPDAKDGKPHFEKGMVHPFKVQ